MRTDAAKKPPVLPLAYPFDWTDLESFSYPLDQCGVPQVPVVGLGLKYNPITIAQYGLCNLQRFSMDESETSLEKAFSCVDWLVENFRDWQEGAGAWVYDYDLDFYGPKAPWVSAMAQGQGISLLLRAFSLKAEDRYLDIAKKAVTVFSMPVTEGGVAAHFPDGGLAFEEFPTDPRSLVLNGNIFAILGLHDFTTFWPQRASEELLQRAAEGLKNNLHHYDTGYWNLYDLHPTRRLASPMYVKVHVQLLNILATLTKDPFFAEYSTKWKKYLTSPRSRTRWLFRKFVEKIRLKL